MAGDVVADGTGGTSVGKFVCRLPVDVGLCIENGVTGIFPGKPVTTAIATTAITVKIIEPYSKYFMGIPLIFEIDF
jgi:hypothetical protein